MEFEQMSLFEIEQPISEGQIIRCVKAGSGFENGKNRIRKHFSEKSTAAEDKNFLINEYGIGGMWPVYTGKKDDNLALDFNASGFTITKIKNPRQKIKITWGRVARIIRDLIDAGEY